MAVKVTDRRTDLDAMRRTLFGGAKTRVLVGITEENGAQIHEGQARSQAAQQHEAWRDGSKIRDSKGRYAKTRAAPRKERSGRSDVTVLQIAIWNEFGTKYAPSRPFLRGWFDKPENQERAEKWLVALMPSVIAGRRTKAQVLDILGLKIVGEIQKTMTGAGIPPPNAESTIRRKGSATATVDTGVMRAKISHVVETKGSGEE